MGIVNSDKELAKYDFITPENYQAVTGSRIPRRGDTVFFACSSGKDLAEEMLTEYNALLASGGSAFEATLDELVMKNKFDEFIPRSTPHLEGKDVFIFQELFDQTSSYTANDLLMELALTADLARDNQANHITIVVPYLAYSRQDKPTAFMRETISAKYVINMLELAGAQDIVFYDPHFPQIVGYKERSRIHALTSIDLFKKAYIGIMKNYGYTDSVVFDHVSQVQNVSPDTGYAKNMELFSRSVNSRFAVGYKSRSEKGETELLDITGKFKGVDIAFIKDDILDTGGSIHNVAKKVHEFGVPNIYVFATHALLNGTAMDRIDEMYEKYGVKGFYFFDTVAQPDKNKRNFIHYLSPANELARVVNSLIYGVSVSNRFTKVHK